MSPRFAAWLTALGCATLLLAGCAQETRCALCKMIVPTETRTIAIVDGREQVICDPRCALTEEHQTGRRVRLVRATDLETQAPLDPRDAFYVSGSDTTPDAHEGTMRTWPTGRASLEWHRCLPSIVAFSTQEAAERHAQAHGGHVLTYPQLGFAETSRQ